MSSSDSCRCHSLEATQKAHIVFVEIVGRNVYGRITVRRRGGGHKRRYRVIDFRRDKFGVPARVEAIEYDPNRSARIALLAMQTVNVAIFGAEGPIGRRQCRVKP